MGQALPIATVKTDYSTCLSLTDNQRVYYFASEIAKTPQQHQIGMMYRTALSEHQAMLFVFSQPEKRVFWMKNVQIPLDMLFFDSHGQLQEIKSNVPPCRSETCPTYPTTQANSQYVLEIKGGTAEKHQLHLGALLRQENVELEHCHD